MMNVNNVNAFSHDEFRRNITQISCENQKVNLDSIRIAGSKPTTDNVHQQVNRAVGHLQFKNITYTRPDAGDYYINNSVGFSTTLGAAAIRDKSLEDAVRLANPIQFHNDGSVTHQSVEEKLLELRTNGLPKELDWNAIDKYYLNQISDKKVWTDLSIEQSVNEISASYAIIKEQISRDFSGSEYDTQIKMLEQVFGTHIERLSQTFASSVNSYFDGESSGQTGEYEKLYRSLQNAIHNKKDEYAGFIAKNKDYAGVNGTQDEWLVRNYRYMSTKLQAAANVQNKNENARVKSDSSLYQFDELRQIDRYAHISSQVLTEGGYGHTSEEEFGFRLGMMALQAAHLNETTNVPQAYRDSLSRKVSRAITYAMDEVDQQYEQMRKVSSFAAQFPPLDRQAVVDVIDLIVKSYDDSKDLLTAIEKGTAKAYSTFLQKQSQSHAQRPRYRMSDNRFWNRFYRSEQMFDGTHEAIATQIDRQFKDTFDVTIFSNLDLYA